MTENKKSTDYEHVECGAFWVRKMRTLFRRLDSHGLGHITLDDLLEVATKVIAECPNLESYKETDLVKAVVDLWYGVFCTHVEELERTTEHVNEAYFVTNLTNAVNGDFKVNFLSIMIEPFFKAADSDNDGKIVSTEFRSLMKAWQGPDRDADLIFKIADTSRTGKMDIDAFHSIFSDFFFSDDIKSKLKNLWGALVNYKRPEDFGQVECGPFWEGKMRTMFRRLTLSEESKLKCHDFILIARNLAQRNHLEKRRADAVTRAMLNIWVKWIAIDKGGRHYAEITEKEFIHNLRAMINGNYRHEIDQMGWTFFKAVEVDKSGFISLQEYRNLQESWKVSREEADGMFKVLDQDKDGKISSDEYLSAFVDYFLGEDPHSPYRGFFGPVISKPSEAR